MSPLTLELIAPVIAIAGLAYSLVFWKGVTSAEDGTPAMQKVALAISTGARAFIKRQYRTITILSLVTGVGMIVLYGIGGDLTKGYEVGGSFLLG